MEYNSTISCSRMFSGICARSGMAIILPVMVAGLKSSQSKRFELVERLPVITSKLRLRSRTATSSPGLGFLLATIGTFGEDGYLDYWRQLV
ncbi:MAG TPA: hypothetical protein PLL18_09870, partial [Flavobacteriales bacterium]|nr:hypothetical protein [Flavobacteriales bacterium]